MKTIRKILKDRRGEGTYISTVLLVLIAVIFIAFIINLFSVISAKQQMDTCADQLVRQIQLAGEVNDVTDELFEDICGNIEAVKNVSYTVDTEYLIDNLIQLGTPFTVTVTAQASLGGFGEINLFPITLVSTASGISEEYWKW